MPTISTRPGPTEAAEYYFTYIEQVPLGIDICELLEAQLSTVVSDLRPITEERSLYRYAPDKWSIREVVSHINDTERVFAFRALWFARGFDSPLPSFDQNIAIAGSSANHRSLASHIDDFQRVRVGTLSLFRNLPDEAWMRRGVASGNTFTARALAYIAAGHVTHHLTLLRERYR
jgi:hypothetical protein